MKSNTIIFAIIFLAVIFGGCGKKVSNKEDFQKYIIGTWVSGGEEVMSGYIVKYKYEFSDDGYCLHSVSTNGGEYIGETSMPYNIGTGIWDDSNEPRYFIGVGRYEFNLVDGNLVYEGTYIGGEEEVLILSKQS